MIDEVEIDRHNAMHCLVTLSSEKLHSIPTFDGVRVQTVGGDNPSSYNTQPL
jgi:hypothetical protein